jgi:hypothetical protein
MHDRKNVNGFNQLFKGGKVALQSVVVHNGHKNIGRVQEEGMSLLLFGSLTEQLDHDQTGKDESGLGWWSVMTLRGDGARTRKVCDIIHVITRTQIAAPRTNSTGNSSSLKGKTSHAREQNLERTWSHN